MNYSPADVLRQYLVDAGLVSMPSLTDLEEGKAPFSEGTDWPAFVSTLPINPDNIVVLYDTKGRMHARLARTVRPEPANTVTSMTIDSPGIQVRVRGVDPPTAYDEMASIWLQLDRVKYSTVNMVDGGQYTITSFVKTSCIIPLGTDPQEMRFSYVLNGCISIQKEV